MTITVNYAGHAVVTDLGRSKGPVRGLSIYGALDQTSARTANALVGNAPNAPLLECLADGLTFTVDNDDVLIAVTGSPMDHASVDDEPLDMDTPISVKAGQQVVLGNAVGGLRTYLAIRGSLAAPRLLGSCAPDTMLGFGLRLHDGDTIETLLPSPPLPNLFEGIPYINLYVPSPHFDDDILVPVLKGPDWSEFTDAGEILTTESYIVDPRSNHVGIRLSGTTPQRSENRGEVLSRAVPVGAIEVPADNALLALQRGRGITAGYPVLAVVSSCGQSRVAQARPGQQLRFSLCDITSASAAARQQQRTISDIATRVNALLHASWRVVPENEWTL
ncbi:biotin-dependent carboxyltransferase family protein [Bifidobacterium tibiigranuli]|jgi:biotin-dependent carboxylase-like uncharacterized protein|uniref:5-oxoprolinase subunit C family protein n=1 Tax=Bifidobacterium tibiigranuli TaxID=2172043 RepID=UPI0026EC2045|nr:biotin-dependent carboxyltransferase family protein [Bifidobacterium tibiigranuli]MCI1650547.1 biotin-dependent carboxyltransferase family protein [Bifidobacterium tibiigranuli]MCI2185687.1 biotin-dependent carboxyltransferase family protein [Bifidobacterium tibiigranuli]MCI2202997.1 biotin-dependent carboxyltransferase family protein [Bifidobacterium tibiigranuli]